MGIEAPPDLTAFVRHHRWRLYVAAARVLGPGGDAEEVVQEVLCLAATRSESFASTEHLLGWAILHVRGRARDRAALRGNRPTVPFEDGPDRPGGADPADLLVGREEAARVRVALASLSERQRDAVLAVDVEGMSYAEAAEHLGITVSTLTPLLQRARRRLRRLLRSAAPAALLPLPSLRRMAPAGMACCTVLAIAGARWHPVGEPGVSAPDVPQIRIPAAADVSSLGHPPRAPRPVWVPREHAGEAQGPGRAPRPRSPNQIDVLPSVPQRCIGHLCVGRDEPKGEILYLGPAAPLPVGRPYVSSYNVVPLCDVVPDTDVTRCEPAP